MYGLKADAIVGYTYHAETLCPEDVVKVMVANGSLADEVLVSTFEGFHFANPLDLPVETVLDMLAKDLILAREDEHSFDSDYFPKVIFSVQIEDEEPCDRCGSPLIEA